MILVGWLVSLPHRQPPEWQFSCHPCSALGRVDGFTDYRPEEQNQDVRTRILASVTGITREDDTRHFGQSPHSLPIISCFAKMTMLPRTRTRLEASEAGQCAIEDLFAISC
jgi:hypothetical protein